MNPVLQWGRGIEPAETAGSEVVHQQQPEDPRGGAVRLLAHDLIDQSFEGGDPGLALAPSKDFRSSHVPGGQVGPGAEALELVFHARRPTPGRRYGPVDAVAGLDAGFLVRREDVVVGGQWAAFPAVGVEIKDATGLLLEVGVPREDPTPVLPRADRVLGQPTPDRGLADGGNDAPADGLPPDVRNVEPRQRQLVLVEELAGERLN